MSEKLKSRKFWFALLGAILPLVAQVMTEEVALAEALQLSVGILGAYIFGQSYVDGQSALPAVEAHSEEAAEEPAAEEEAAEE